PGPPRPGPRPRGWAGAGGLAGPGRLRGPPTQPPRLRPPLPMGHRARPRHPAGRDPRAAASPTGTPSTATIGWLGGACGHRRRLGRPLWAGGPSPGAGPGRYRSGGPAQPAAMESTRNLYNLAATGALNHREVHQGLLGAAERCGLLAEEPRQTHRTLTSGRQVAHPGRPAQPTSPEHTHPSPPRPARAAGEPIKDGKVWPWQAPAPWPAERVQGWARAAAKQSPHPPQPPPPETVPGWDAPP